MSMVISELRERIVPILKHRSTILGSFFLVNFIGLLAVVLDGESTGRSLLPYRKQVWKRRRVTVGVPGDWHPYRDPIQPPMMDMVP